jgi:TfoX/Sxy family transcriptional regulator of competence genes
VPFDEKVAARVRATLAGQKDVVERRMMGGLCFMVRGAMCCCVDRSTLMVRVGADALEQTLALPHTRPMTIGGKRLTGFVGVDPPGFRTEKQLARWVQRGIDFVDANRRSR